jgi:hypothetical protein
MAVSSSAIRAVSASGSKVVTDPGKPGPELVELLCDGRVDGVGHRAIVPVSLDPSHTRREGLPDARA